MKGSTISCKRCKPPGSAVITYRKSTIISILMLLRVSVGLKTAADAGYVPWRRRCPSAGRERDAVEGCSWGGGRYVVGRVWTVRWVEMMISMC